MNPVEILKRENVTFRVTQRLYIVRVDGKDHVPFYSWNKLIDYIRKTYLHSIPNCFINVGDFIYLHG